MGTIKFNKTGLEDAITEIDKSKKAFQDELNIFQNMTVPQEYSYYSRIKNIGQQVEGTLKNINTLISNIQTNITSMENAESKNEAIVDDLPSTITSSTSTKTTTSNITTTQNNTQNTPAFQSFFDTLINENTSTSNISIISKISTKINNSSIERI